MDQPRSRGCSFWRRKTNHFLVTTMSLMVMSLVFLLAWEGARPLLLVFTPHSNLSTLNWYFGDREQTKAIWASTGEDEAGMERTLNTKWRSRSRKKVSLDSTNENIINEEIIVDITLGARPRKKSLPLVKEAVVTDRNFRLTDSRSLTKDAAEAIYEDLPAVTRPVALEVVEQQTNEDEEEEETWSSQRGSPSIKSGEDADRDSHFPPEEPIALKVVERQTNEDKQEEKTSSSQGGSPAIKSGEEDADGDSHFPPEENLKPIEVSREPTETDTANNSSFFTKSNSLVVEIIVDPADAVSPSESDTPLAAEAETDGTVKQILVDAEDDAASKRTNKSSTCDFTQGYWVKDANRSLYDGKKCKAYLAGMWACRQMNRPDFEYEKLRWQPDGCDLPSFTRESFLERMRNKVIAFVGDSLGRQQFQSLMCMLTGGKDDEEDNNVEDVAEEWNLAGKGSHRGRGWVYRFKSTNTTLMFYWSATLNLVEYNKPTEKDGYAALHLDQLDIFLREDLNKLDLLILNSGHHWNRGKFEHNKWHMYVDNKPLVGRKLAGIGDAYNFSMFKTVENLDAQIAQNGGKPTVFMRTLSPRHFKNGDWNSGGSCDSVRPQYGQKVANYKGPETTMVIDHAVSGSQGVHLLNVHLLSSIREEAHISKYGNGRDSEHQDCLHWCLPGVPDVWNELLHGYLLADSSLASGQGVSWQ